jgi:NADPH-dependent glutamate synthase beta subunit-like oxidoreductase
MKFLKQVASGEGRIAGRRVAVVGGGNTALDAARCAIRCGASEVYVVYRRSRQEMPASDEEIALSEEEGVRILYTAMPIRVESSEGFVSGLRVRGGYLDMPKSGHRRSLVPVEGVEYVLPVDQVIVAVSQLPDSGALAGSRGLKVSSAGTIEAVDEFGATALKGVFAAGDAAGWAKAGQPHMASIIEAIASGRKVALNVDSFLSGKGVEDARSRWGESRVVDKRRVLASNIEREPAARGAIPHRDLAERARDFEPVELSLTEQDALREAQRCLRCGCGVGCELCRRICPYFAVKPVEGYGLAVDKELCSGCGLCIERCPIANIDAVPLAKR